MVTVPLLSHVTDHFLHYNTELAQLVSTTSYYSHCRVADKSLGTRITLDEEQPFCRRSYLSVSPHNPAIPPSCPHLSCRFAPCLGTPFHPYYISHGYCVLSSFMVFSDRSLVAWVPPVYTIIHANTTDLLMRSEVC